MMPVVEAREGTSILCQLDRRRVRVYSDGSHHLLSLLNSVSRPVLYAQLVEHVSKSSDPQTDASLSLLLSELILQRVERSIDHVVHEPYSGMNYFTQQIGIDTGFTIERLLDEPR